MKTNELIKQLRAADPEGQLDVVVGGTAIYTVEVLPGYYDGAYEHLVQEPEDSPYYNIRGGIISKTGYKVVLGIVSLEDALFDCEASGDYFPICLEGMSEQSEERYRAEIAKWRKEAREFYEKRDERKAKLEAIRNENNKN